MTKANPPTRLAHKAIGLVSILARKIAPEIAAKAEAAETRRLYALAFGDEQQRRRYLASFDRDGRYLHWSGYWASNSGDVFVPAMLAWKADQAELEDMAAKALEEAARDLLGVTIHVPPRRMGGRP